MQDSWQVEKMSKYCYCKQIASISFGFGVTSNFAFVMLCRISCSVMVFFYIGQCVQVQSVIVYEVSNNKIRCKHEQFMMLRKNSSLCFDVASLYCEMIGGFALKFLGSLECCLITANSSSQSCQLCHRSCDVCIG